MYRATFFLNRNHGVKDAYYAYWYELPQWWELQHLCTSMVSSAYAWWTFSSSTVEEVPDDV